MSNICVGASSTGGGTGADWNNQIAWSSVTFVRGNTYYLADGAYGSKSLSTALSGAVLIIIKKATVSDHGIATGWSDAFGDGQAIISSTGSGLSISTGYWTIDGQVGTSNNDDYGIKIVTTGTGDAQCAILARSGVISHLTLIHVSAQAPTSSGASSNRAFEELTNIYGSAVSVAITIQYCHFKGGLVNLAFSGDGSTDQGNIIEYCTLELAGNQEHSECIQLANTNNITIRYNVLQNLLYPSTTYIEPQSNGGPPCVGIYIYGNIFRATDAGEGTSNPSCVSMTSGETCDTVVFYNNTIYGLHGGDTADTGLGFSSAGNNSTNITVRNNIWNSCSFAPGIDGFVTASNNLLNTGSPSFVNAAGGNFRLLSATAAGTTLSSPYNLDADGTTRGGDGTWDLGAFEFGSGGGGTTTTKNKMTNPRRITGVRSIRF